MAEHHQHLEEILKRLQEHGVHLEKEKCKFCVEEVEYLGYQIEGIPGVPDDEEPTGQGSPLPMGLAGAGEERERREKIERGGRERKGVCWERRREVRR